MISKAQCPAMKGDPVNVATGNSFEREEDVSIGTGLVHYRQSVSGFPVVWRWVEEGA